METVQTKNSVLEKEALDRKFRRMALQVAEQNIDETGIMVAAINGNGEVVAQYLVDELKNICSLNIERITIQLNKKDPLKVAFNQPVDVNGKVVLVVDDVSNTGKTILYALKPFLEFNPKKIQTLVLVERSHKLFPVQTDYAGLSITTTLQEHITVEVAEGKITGAFLQ